MKYILIALLALSANLSAQSFDFSCVGQISRPGLTRGLTVAYDYFHGEAQYVPVYQKSLRVSNGNIVDYYVTPATYIDDNGQTQNFAVITNSHNPEGEYLHSAIKVKYVAKIKMTRGSDHCILRDPYNESQAHPAFSSVCYETFERNLSYVFEHAIGFSLRNPKLEGDSDHNLYIDSAEEKLRNAGFHKVNNQAPYNYHDNFVKLYPDNSRFVVRENRENNGERVRSYDFRLRPDDYTGILYSSSIDTLIQAFEQYTLTQ